MVSWYLRSNPNEDALRQGASIRNIKSAHYILKSVMVVVHYISTILFKLLFSSGSEYIKHENLLLVLINVCLCFNHFFL